MRCWTGPQGSTAPPRTRRGSDSSGAGRETPRPPSQALVGPEVVPLPGGQVEGPVGGPGPGDGRHQQVRAQEVLAAQLPHVGVGGVVVGQGAHQGLAVGVRPPGQGVEVRQQAHPELGEAPADGLHLLPVGPGQVLAPDPPVGAEQGAQGAELEPPRVQLGGQPGGEEAPDVGAPVGDAGEGGVEPQGHLRLEGGEGGVDVPRPGGGAVALHPCTPGAAQHPGAPVRAVAGLALGEGLHPQQGVGVVQQAPRPSGQGRRRGGALGAVQPPAGHPQVDQPAVLRPPPLPRFGEGEVDRALALSRSAAEGRRPDGLGGGTGVRPRSSPGRRARAAGACAGGSRKPCPSASANGSAWGCSTGYSWVTTRNPRPSWSSRIIPSGSGHTPGSNSRWPDADVPALGLPVGGQEDQRVAGDAPSRIVLRQGPDLVRAVPVAGGLEVAQGPARGQGRVAGETGVGLHDLRGRGAGQDVEVDGRGVRLVEQHGAAVAALHVQARPGGGVEEEAEGPAAPDADQQRARPCPCPGRGRGGCSRASGTCPGAPAAPRPRPGPGRSSGSPPPWGGAGPGAGASAPRPSPGRARARAPRRPRARGRIRGRPSASRKLSAGGSGWTRSVPWAVLTSTGAVGLRRVRASGPSGAGAAPAAWAPA